MKLTLKEAKEECERWLAYLKQQADKSVALQRLAADRRRGTCDEAEMHRRRDAIMGPGVTVYDGGNLESAVRTLLRALETPPAGVSEAVKMLDEKDREYNRKTNALIARHAGQVSTLVEAKNDALDAAAELVDQKYVALGRYGLRDAILAMKEKP